MELKKYALLKDNRVVEIYKKETFGYSYIDKEIDGIVFTRSILISDVKKTSDNILDLVEVGDLVELDNDWEILKVLRINKDNQPVCLVRTSSNIEEYAFKDYRKKHITAIYKRQLNGDYKRYEVKGVRK